MCRARRETDPRRSPEDHLDEDHQHIEHDQGDAQDLVEDQMVKKHGKAKELYRIGLAHKNVGMAHRTLGQWVESVPHLDEAMVLLSDRYGPTNSQTLGAQESMVDSILRGGMDEPRVVSLSQNAFDGRMKPGESGHNYDRYVDSGVLVVDTLMVSGDPEEARRILDELLAFSKPSL